MTSATYAKSSRFTRWLAERKAPKNIKWWYHGLRFGHTLARQVDANADDDTCIDDALSTMMHALVTMKRELQKSDHHYRLTKLERIIDDLSEIKY